MSFFGEPQGKPEPQLTPEQALALLEEPAGDTSSQQGDTSGAAAVQQQQVTQQDQQVIIQQEGQEQQVQAQQTDQTPPPQEEEWAGHKSKDDFVRSHKELERTVQQLFAERNEMQRQMFQLHQMQLQALQTQPQPQQVQQDDIWGDFSKKLEAEPEKAVLTLAQKIQELDRNNRKLQEQVQLSQQAEHARLMEGTVEKLRTKYQDYDSLQPEMQKIYLSDLNFWNAVPPQNVPQALELLYQRAKFNTIEQQRQGELMTAQERGRKEAAEAAARAKQATTLGASVGTNPATAKTKTPQELEIEAMFNAGKAQAGPEGSYFRGY